GTDRTSATLNQGRREPCPQLSQCSDGQTPALLDRCPEARQCGDDGRASDDLGQVCSCQSLQQCPPSRCQCGKRAGSSLLQLLERMLQQNKHRTNCTHCGLHPTANR